MWNGRLAVQNVVRNHESEHRGQANVENAYCDKSDHDAERNVLPRVENFFASGRDCVKA